MIKCPYCNKVCKNSISLSKHTVMQHDKRIEDTYKLLNPDSKNTCLNCGKVTNFLSISRGYRSYCSNKCASESLKGDDEKVKNKIVKCKKTKLERYGDSNFVNFEKQKITNLKKFGVENIFERTDLIKESNLKKYGVDHLSKNIDIQNRIKDTKRTDFIEKMFDGERLGDNILPIFDPIEYFGVCGEYLFKCEKCSTEFKSNIDNGKVPVCPTCFPSTRSKYETEIIDFIRSNFIDLEIIHSDRKTLPSKKELDIYIPSKNIAIEFNGVVWHSENFGGKDRNYHIGKTIECDGIGIHLIHINEVEWVNKKDIIKSKILNKLGFVDNHKIYARNCKIHPVNSDDKKRILNEHHIQGNDASSISYGLYYNCQLVSIMTFGSRRVSMGAKLVENEYELYRFCSSRTVIGGAGKLLSHFIKHHNPIKIVTYSDRRFSNVRSMYSKIGFELVSETKPNYWYFNMRNPMKLYHRYGFRKNILNNKLKIFDANLTEWENMKSNGYDRIWDCGNLKYEMIFQNNINC